MVRSGGQRQRRGAAYFLYRCDPGSVGLRLNAPVGRNPQPLLPVRWSFLGNYV